MNTITVKYRMPLSTRLLIMGARFYKGRVADDIDTERLARQEKRKKEIIFNDLFGHLVGEAA